MECTQSVRQSITQPHRSRSASITLGVRARARACIRLKHLSTSSRDKRSPMPDTVKISAPETTPHRSWCRREALLLSGAYLRRRIDGGSL